MQKQEKGRCRLEEHESLAGVIFSSLFLLLRIFLIYFVLVYLTANCLVRSLRVQGGSMYPTLKMGEFGLGNAFFDHFQEIKRGSIAIVYSRKKTHTYWVKCVIGLPDKQICANGDTVYINNTAIQEPYLNNDYTGSIRLTENYKLVEDLDEVQPGEDEYYLMGDNRYASKDSREIGAFRRGSIKAVDFFTALPFNKMRVAEQGMNKNKRTRSDLDIVYTILDFARLILITIVTTMIVLVFTTRKEEVRGTSIHLALVEGESVIINMAVSYIGEIKRFDMVVAREYRNDDLWVKRVIGLPGEAISYRESVLYVDGRAMKEPFLGKKCVGQVKKSANKLYLTQGYISKKLGKDEYLLVGDNRNELLDSRSDAVEPFRQEQIIARGVFVYQPPSKMKYIGNDG